MLDRLFRIVSTLFLIVLISGCTKNFQVVANIPPPLVEPSAVVAQLDYSDEFRAYKFIEKTDDRSLESVDFGVAQVSLFDGIFSSLFKLNEGGSNAHDLKIEPQILDFQYSAPRETKLKLYEVWVKYRLKVTDSNNEQLADWVVKGYGKTPTRMLSSHLKAFNTACNVALRDVGAQLAIGFRNQPSIKAYLVSRLGDSEGLQPAVIDAQITDGSVDVAEGSVDVAEGSVGTAEGSFGTAEGSLGTAEGSFGTAEGSIGTAEGSIGTAEGSIESAEGSRDSLDKVKQPVESPEASLDLELVSVAVSNAAEMSGDVVVLEQISEELP